MCINILTVIADDVAQVLLSKEPLAEVQQVVEMSLTIKSAETVEEQARPPSPLSVSYGDLHNQQIQQLPQPPPQAVLSHSTQIPG